METQEPSDYYSDDTDTGAARASILRQRFVWTDEFVHAVLAMRFEDEEIASAMRQALTNRDRRVVWVAMCDKLAEKYGLQIDQDRLRRSINKWRFQHRMWKAGLRKPGGPPASARPVSYILTLDRYFGRHNESSFDTSNEDADESSSNLSRPTTGTSTSTVAPRSTPERSSSQSSRPVTVAPNTVAAQWGPASAISRPASAAAATATSQPAPTPTLPASTSVDPAQNQVSAASLSQIAEVMGKGMKAIADALVIRTTQSLTERGEQRELMRQQERRTERLLIVQQDQLAMQQRQLDLQQEQITLLQELVTQIRRANGHEEDVA
ncbi:hypothetical protein Poli38472_008916 [Pythium oligandrum]|uniref:Uncharacterized protein n=1 Tax=Pythium oligandrum TaxID=41045 RepID=A0A8K1C4H5_PYTOL|nr:hypothetical protein Poli38472_008916 [Pythium oligandrum]|eukprot:TMW56268.1 hypothetical protein Poli38472_008916 [Pythium oligandrum]